MTRDDAIAFIQEQLIFRKDLVSTIQNNLIRAQIQLEAAPGLKPWFLLSEKSFRFTTAFERRLPVPVDFLQEAEQGTLVYIDQEGEETELEKGSYDELLAGYSATMIGHPEAYSLDGKYFNLWPKPDAMYQLAMFYYKKDQPLVTNVENNWLREAPFVLIGQAGMLTAQAIRNMQARETFLAMRQEAQATLVAQIEAREHTNREYQMGGPEN